LLGSWLSTYVFAVDCWLSYIRKLTVFLDQQI
jgi:hypothetical protein